jgi:long-chain acyl-CoA synthetase
LAWWLTDGVNLASVVGPHAADTVALLTDGGQAMTYGDLRDDVARLRGGLRELGVQRGDRVALALPNSPDFVAVYLAVLGVGAIAVPLNPSSPVLELQRELAAVAARALVAGPVAGRTASALDRAVLTELTAVVEPSELRGAEPADIEDMAPDDVAVLVFTSGTAGPSLPAMLTHANLLANIDQILAGAQAQTATDRVLAVLPTFHIYGLNAVLGASLAAGSTVVLSERFEAEETLDLVGREGVTVVPGVPTMWSAWAELEDVTSEAFVSVRLASSGAAALDPAVRRRLREVFGLTVVEGYGLTEASPAVTSGLGVDAPDGSIGIPLPHVTLRLVDTANEDALVGDPGEIWVRGPNVFAGYWQDAAATASALTPDGWLRTGDVALVDDDGFLYLVDRAKDLIIVSGFNVFPAEVEEVIAGHPGVAEVAVVGIPDPRTGEAVVAYVVPGGDERLTDRDVVAFCGERLAHYKCPVEVTFVTELPHNLNGKVLRRALR